MQSAWSSWSRVCAGSTITLDMKWMRSLVAPAWLAALSAAPGAPPIGNAEATVRKVAMELARWARFCWVLGWWAKWFSRTWPSSWASTKAISSSDLAPSSKPKATTIEPSASE